MKDAVIDAIQPMTNKASLLGALLSTVGTLTLTEWLAVGGFVMAAVASIGGLALNAYFKRRRDAREQMLADLQVTLMRAGQVTLQPQGEDD